MLPNNQRATRNPLTIAIDVHITPDGVNKPFESLNVATRQSVKQLGRGLQFEQIILKSLLLWADSSRNSTNSAVFCKRLLSGDPVLCEITKSASQQINTWSIQPFCQVFNSFFNRKTRCMSAIQEFSDTAPSVCLLTYSIDCKKCETWSRATKIVLKIEGIIWAISKAVWCLALFIRNKGLEAEKTAKQSNYKTQIGKPNKKRTKASLTRWFHICKESDYVAVLIHKEKKASIWAGTAQK